MFLISPTEHDILSRPITNGASSSLPELYGSDLLILSRHGKMGFQRKQFPQDFFESVRDGRLGRELTLMLTIPMRRLVVEGIPEFTSDGHLLSDHYYQWTRKGIRNLLRSVEMKFGVSVEWTGSIEDTIEVVNEWEEYLNIGTHRSLLIRPKFKIKDDWGEVDGYRWGLHMMQGFPGVGVGRAEAVLRYFGRVPIRWDCSVEELKTAMRVGDKKAGEIYSKLGGWDDSEEVRRISTNGTNGTDTNSTSSRSQKNQSRKADKEGKRVSKHSRGEQQGRL